MTDMSAGTIFVPTDNDEGNDNVATPTVTITVAGAPVTATTTPLGDAETLREGLHMLYAQVIKGDERRQWIIFPPANKVLGTDKDTPNVLLMLARHQQHAGNRSKWFESKVYAHSLAQELTRYEGDGWTVGGIATVPLELDDYLKVWGGETPHKAIRAVDRTIQAAYGITVK